VNKKLYGNKVKVPEDVISYLTKCFESAKGANDKTEGFRRNKSLRDEREVTYQQLKRMKNFFDTFKGSENDLPFILNGGHYVKNWVNKVLDGMRDNISLGDKVKDQFLPDQLDDVNTKINIKDLNRPSKSHKTSLGDYDLQITESLRRIKDIINKII